MYGAKGNKASYHHQCFEKAFFEKENFSHVVDIYVHATM